MFVPCVNKIKEIQRAAKNPGIYMFGEDFFAKSSTAMLRSYNNEYTCISYHEQFPTKSFHPGYNVEFCILTLSTM